MSTASFATEAFDLDYLGDLFKKFQRVEAYSYARQHIEQQEGNPYFDYYYGVSAIDSGHASEGVFALERVLLAFPQDDVTRLELARGYFVLEEYARSRQEFESVLANNPPEAVQQNAQVYLDQIRLKEARYKTTSNAYVEFGAGIDSNVNSAPDAEAFTGIPLTDSTGQEDTFMAASGSYQLTYPFSPGWTFNTSLTGDIRKNSDFDQFDTMTATLQLGVSALDNQSKYSIDTVVQQFNLDGDNYRMLTGATFGWRYTLSQKSALTTSLQYAMLDFDTVPTLNSELTVLNLGYNYQFTSAMSPVFIAGLKLGMEDPEDSDAGAMADVERDILGLRLGLILSLSQRIALQTSISTQQSEYGGPQELAPTVTREDTFNTADLNLLWLFEKNWRLNTKIGYSKNDSNVAIRNYDRTRISLNLNYAF